MPSERHTVFISYSHVDEIWLKRLRVHLRPLERVGLVDIFDDTRIKGGMEWRAEIEMAMEKAKVAILLISADFLASDFIVENELPPLLEKAKDGGARILPIIVSPSRFTTTPELSAFQACNSPAEPLIAMSVAKSEEVLRNVADLVETVIGKEATTHKGGDGLLKPPKSGGGKCLLNLLFSNKSLKNNGITEVRDFIEVGQTFYIVASDGRGRVHKMPTRSFNKGIGELVTLGWLQVHEGKPHAAIFRVTTAFNSQRLEVGRT
jgi:hypothetical protein